jgi:hypothetical protein
MNQQTTSDSGANGPTTPDDLFVLTDEQILEIAPEPACAGRPQDLQVAGSEPEPAQSVALERAQAPATAQPASTATGASSSATERGSPNTEHDSRSTALSAQAGVPFGAQGKPVLTEPPAWLAAQMNDTWNGAEARALWDRTQNSEREAAAYREVFAKPEAARAAAERARLLEDIDRSYFGAQGSTPEQSRAARAQLAATLLREDPAAFREMVFESLRALEATGESGRTPSVADAFRRDSNVSTSNNSFAGTDSAVDSHVAPPTLAAAHGTRSTGDESRVTSHESLSAYAAFENAANADLEKSVGGAIERALLQALPNIAAADSSSNVGARFSASPSSGAASLQARLSDAIRQDVEKALQGDRQLGEQVAQILAGRRFDHETRAQVVRLINDRAQQLVPGAAKRALNDWTQATLAAHRARSERAEAASARREVATAASAPRDVHAAPKNTTNRATHEVQRPASRSRINYGKLSDEQILDL